MKYADMTYRDYDALAYNPKIHGDDEKVAVNHIAKKRLKNKTNEVVFNPADHKCAASTCNSTLSSLAPLALTCMAVNHGQGVHHRL
jgi:hypothetical protein